MEIPSVVIDRLPLYARALARLDSDGREVVSSQELGTHLNVTPAQIRKDLSYFGRFGKQGRGYNVRKLLEELRRILGLNRQWRIAIVGAGRLGRAIAGYEGFTPQGFRIVEAFDSDPGMIGSTINSLVIRNTESLETVLSDAPVDIGIVAVPQSQNVAQLVRQRRLQIEGARLVFFGTDKLVVAFIDEDCCFGDDAGVE